MWSKQPISVHRHWVHFAVDWSFWRMCLNNSKYMYIYINIILWFFRVVYIYMFTIFHHIWWIERFPKAWGSKSFHEASRTVAPCPWTSGTSCHGGWVNTKEKGGLSADSPMPRPNLMYIGLGLTEAGNSSRLRGWWQPWCIRFQTWDLAHAKHLMFRVPTLHLRGLPRWVETDRSVHLV